MRLLTGFLATITLCAGAAAHAEAPPAAGGQAAAAEATKAAVGAKIYDKAGAEVGTIEAIDGGDATVTIGAHRVSLPTAALASTDKGLTINMTKAEITAAAEKAASANAPTTGAEAPATTDDKDK